MAGPVLAEELQPAGESAAKVTWGACPEDVEAGAHPLQCATVKVPLDYAKPDGTKIKIMISRVASENETKRRGVMLTNPGGPGGAGLSMPADLVTLGLPTTVMDGYDLIGMDPRGVGHSSPVSCGFTADQKYNGNIPPYAENKADVVKQAKAAKAVAEQCAAHDQDGRMRHMTTANTARDMDQIRMALGEKKISYFGASYGSALGAAYASLFPERSDRIVIDSNLGGTSLDRAGLRRFGLGAEDRFPDFAKFAAARHASYGLGETPSAVRKNYHALAEKLAQNPVAGIDGATFRVSVFVGLYGNAFAPMAQFWQSLAASDDDSVRRQIDKGEVPGAEELPQLGAQQQGSAAPSPNDNFWSAFLAVTCNDSAWPKDVSTYQRSVAQDRKRYPLFGAASANINPCAFWHHESEGPVKITDEGPENILVVQNLRDPATPLKGGEIAREAFGERARLVSIDQGGHGAYVFNDNPCGLNVTTSFLVDGTFPEQDTFCQASQTSGLKLNSADREARAEVLDRLGR